MHFMFAKLRFCALSLLAVLLCLVSHARAGFIYVSTDSTTANMIYGFSVNETTGELTALDGFPVSTGFVGAGLTNLELIAVDPLNKRLYVGNRGSSNITAYSIDDSTGAITPLSFSPISTVANERTIKVHPTGSPLIVGADTFASFVITSSSAAPAPNSPYEMPTGVSPAASAMSPSGDHYYAGGNSGNFFAGYNVNAATGELTAISGSPFDSGSSNPVPLAVDASGRLYVSSSRQSLLRVYTLASGIPTAVTGSPFSGPQSGFASLGQVHPNGQYLLFSNRNRAHVYSFSITGEGSATNMSLVAGAPFATGGTTSQAGIFNTAGTFFFVANGGSRNLTRLAFNAATGVLSDQFIQPADTMGTEGTLSGVAYMPAAASIPVMIGGRVTRADGYGVDKAFVTIEGPSGIRTVRTNSFGYYRFSGVSTGSVYTISVSSKLIEVAPQKINVTGERLDVNFSEASSALKGSKTLKKN